MNARKLIPLTLVGYLALVGVAQAGEVVVKIPEGPFRTAVGCVGYINRVFKFSNDPVKPDRENITGIVDSLLPILSHDRIPKLSAIPAEMLVLKDGVILQMPDEKLRYYLDKSYRWLGIDDEPSEKTRQTLLANYCLMMASRGLWDNIEALSIEVEVKFDG